MNNRIFEALQSRGSLLPYYGLRCGQFLPLDSEDPVYLLLGFPGNTRFPDPINLTAIGRHDNRVI
jgi:hypothetical protein